MQPTSAPLCVDLDGTLIRTDILIEAALALLRRNPLRAFHLAGWLLRGKACLKRQLALRVDFDAAKLPFDKRVLEWLRSQATDRRLVLCTASDQRFADAVADHTGIFAEAYGSDGTRNLSGRAKATMLVERYGDRGFDYVGNAPSDLHVWRRSRRAIVVNGTPRLARRVARECEVERVFARPQGRRQAWLRAVRPHQWLKNLLVFLPLLTAHLVLEPNALMRSGLAFACFCLCASGVYLLNDLLDLESDRGHPRKRLRPFAAGDLPLSSGLFATVALTIVAFALALTLSPRFVMALAGYYGLTVAYSFLLKSIPMLDTVVLAALYTLRIIAGTLAIRVAFSFWLLAFSMFLFFCLALVKRYTELRDLLHNGRVRVARGYAVDDLALIQSLGAASGYLSVLVLALYINSAASAELYHRPQMLWLLCPALLYWISRAWLVAHRGAMHDDPVIFAISDRVSRVLLVLCAIVVFGAI